MEVQPNIKDTPNTKEEKKRKAEEGKRIILRFFILGFLGFFCCILVVGKVLSLSYGERGDKWLKLENSHRQVKEKVVYPKRGSIYASTGELLHVSVPEYKMTFDFRAEAYNQLCRKEIKNKDGKKVQLKKRDLGKERKILRNLSKALFHAAPRLKKFGYSQEHYAKKWMAYSRKGLRGATLLSPKLTLDEYNRLLNDSLMYDEKGHRSGVYRAMRSEITVKRVRPNGTSLNCVLGGAKIKYKDSITYTDNGIEGYFNQQLAGQYGICQEGYTSNHSTRVIKKDPQDGANIYTTIDMELQDVVNETVLELMGKYRPRSATAAVMECATGKIVAITSKVMNDRGIISESYNQLFRDNMEPGSTTKVLSLLAVLEDGIINSETIIDTGKGAWRYRGKNIKSHGRGRIPAKEVLAISDNAGVAKIIVGFYESQPDKFIDKINSFGLDIPLNSEDYREFVGGRMPIVRNPKMENWNPLDLAVMSYGYSLSIPPIYILSIYNAVANGGNFMRPYFVEKVVSAKGDVLEEYEPQIIRKNILKETTCQEMTKMMREVVLNGTGRALNKKDVSLAGKTGTAIAYVDNQGYKKVGGEEYVYSFCSFFPSDNPRYTVYANLQRPRVKHPANEKFPISSARSAGAVSLAVARADKRRHSKIYFKEKVTPEVFEVKENEKAKREVMILKTDETELNRMPNLIGYSLSDANYLLQRRGVKIKIVGYGYVQSQSKPAHSKIKRGETVTLTLAH